MIAQDPFADLAPAKASALRRRALDARAPAPTGPAGEPAKKPWWKLW